MNQVRSNTFETNSSSTHSICMCMKDQYDSWASDWDGLEADSILYSNCKEKLVTVEEAIKDVNSYREKVKLSDVIDANSPEHDDAIESLRDEGYMTCNDFDDYTEEDSYYEEFVTPGGETVVAFGNYGWDG